MRLISQSGKVDISYDHCTVIIRDDNSIHACMMQDIADFNMGKYNDEQEAIDILSRLRASANRDGRYFQFPVKQNREEKK